MAKRNTNKLTIIIGCGRLGAELANSISDDNGDVIIIDNDKDSFRRLSFSFGGLATVGDGTDIDLLKASGIEKASTVAAVTDNENVNIMAAMMAKNLFNVKNVILRVNDNSKQELYKDSDIQVICPSELTSRAVKAMIDGGR
ncbi:MAG TPA: TrkA family potassium uptake protein [Erysipelotrichaceae bacterium]|nr:TrkA family potassium uptake protein [Erysipelotrichaceae bacterium]HQB32602.1 TrkA family potassium uptake protein [Erysipelotrichaceae bacterium]